MFLVTMDRRLFCLTALKIHTLTLCSVATLCKFHTNVPPQNQRTLTCHVRLQNTVFKETVFFPFHWNFGKTKICMHKGKIIFWGHAVAQLAEALRYKSKGRGFDSRWCHWSFSLTWTFRPHYGPGVDSASNRNEYQEYFLGLKAAGA